LWKQLALFFRKESIKRTYGKRLLENRKANQKRAVGANPIKVIFFKLNQSVS